MNNTINYYDAHAEDYFNTTAYGNMEEIYKLFLQYLKPNSFILDYGCGSGRDSKYFLENGYKVKAIDGSEKMCELASKFIEKPVYHMDFLELNDTSTYDGIWACASLLHLETPTLLLAIEKMIKALKKHGIIYISLKMGREPKKIKMEDILLIIQKKNF